MACMVSDRRHVSYLARWRRSFATWPVTNPIRKGGDYTSASTEPQLTSFSQFSDLSFKMSLPGPLGVIGKKHVEQFGRWLPSLVTFGGVSSLGMLYFTDWKVVLKYVPFYGGKFSEEE